MDQNHPEKLASRKGTRVAVLSAGSPSGVGGAERFYQGLLDGLQSIGCEASVIPVPATEPSFHQIVDNYSAAKALDLQDYDVVISSKSPTYAVRHPNHVVFLMHTIRVYDDMFKARFPNPSRETYVERARIKQLDYQGLSRAKVRFAQSHEVARRLYRWCGLEARTLHPPLAFGGFKKGPIGDYFFLPGRLHPWKRVDLVVEAVKRSTLPLRLLVAGTGECEEDLKNLAAGDSRIQFLGRIDDERLVSLYQSALGVPFVPLREDYGYITLEAFASGKPVITCSDSGEPVHFVRQNETGLVSAPNADSLRQSLEWLWENRDAAARMGANGYELTKSLSWSNVATELVSAALDERPATSVKSKKVAVLDMQPITPAVGGGRLRLKGLYHDLGDEIQCRYVGSYDWPGERYRAQKVSDSLLEIAVPLSEAHHSAAVALGRLAGGKGVIDLAFSEQANLSPDYLNAVRSEVVDADVVIFSHPWVFPLVKDCVRSNQVVIYDSHNVEAFLRAQFLDETNSVERNILRNVVRDEFELGRRADWILACSHEDMLRFHRLFGFSTRKIRVVPNGVMAFVDEIRTPEPRSSARTLLGLSQEAFVGVFIGSGYGPNVEAAEFINRRLAPSMPAVHFVIAGGVGDMIKPAHDNVHVTGLVDEQEKFRWFHASDFALNPMTSGSGTNIKMFDFMAMSLPIVATATGARGIDTAGREAMFVAEPSVDAFKNAIGNLADVRMRSRYGAAARQCVEDDYAWERISRQLGAFISAREQIAGQPRPFFSVVVPTYERPARLGRLMECLKAQIECEFEVIVVDQSKQRWSGADSTYGFPLTYHRNPVKGAIRARNVGAMIAQGEVIAFVDDDCEPTATWLLNARPYFNDELVVGVEGLIQSDHPDDPDWRPVTNVGFEGIGFMTANLFARSSVFQALGGFDLQFDRPHFREDTDLGWRMQAVGDVPFATDVRVFHPAQPRSSERESAAERIKFFQKDALLYAKHPQKYKELFEKEAHYRNTAGFMENLMRGFERAKIETPSWIRQFASTTVRS